MLAINDVLQKRYRVVRQLGQGGMGAVYEAFDERVGASVALKEILIDLTRISDSKQQELVRRAFEREKTSLAKVKHEAFPRIIDYFVENDSQYLVMELIHGDDLGELLQKNQQPFQVSDVLRWTEQLLDALDYLHTLSPPIIHRDIKPQNLKLTSRQKIKLLDFGIAKGDDAQGGSTVTNQTFIAATLHYSPLEQILRVLDPTFQEVIRQQYDQKSEEILQYNADARSDLYALGATLYHLLTARLPIDALKRSLDIWSGKPDPLPPPRSLNPIIPEAISDCLMKAMEVERENRFASALEMQAALNKAGEAERQQEEEAKRQAWFGEQEKLANERRRAEQKMQTEQFGLQNQMQANTEILNKNEAATLHQVAAEHASETANVETQMPPAETQAFSAPKFAPRNFVQNANTGAQSQTAAGSSNMTEQFAATHQANSGKDEPTLIKSSAVTTAPQKKSRVFLFILLPVIGFLALFGGIFGMWFVLSGSEKADVTKPAVNAAEEQQFVNPTPEESNPAAGGSALIVSTPTPDASPTPAAETTEKPANTATVQARPTAPRPQPTRANTPRPQPTRKVTVDDIITDN